MRTTLRTKVKKVVISRIQEDAYLRLSHDQRETSNLYLDTNIREAGEPLGPEFQGLVAPRDSVLVFVDHQPLANFGHECRYLLYDPESAALIADLGARFPPQAGPKTLETLRAFHLPVRTDPNLDTFRVRRILRCPIMLPEGDRYAILYSGMSNTRHLNDLEFCYRMLIDRYAFNPANIAVLNYDGTTDTQNGTPTTWPGDGSAYRIVVTGPGNSTGFQTAFADIKPKLKPDDLLFIHTNNHGDNDGSGSFLCEYPDWGTYTATSFCADLATLPPYKALVVVMEQCNSGGFNAPVIAASTAASTSVASAAIATQSSWATSDGNWDSFARDWIAAEAGYMPNGASLAHNPDTNGNGVVSALEAFTYAQSVKNPSDTPNYNSSSSVADSSGLAQSYVFWWWWCWIILPILNKRLSTRPTAIAQPVPDPGPEFAAQLAAALPELQQLITRAIDQRAIDLRRDITPEVDKILESHFAPLP